MKTKIIDAKNLNNTELSIQLKEAVSSLMSGDVVCFPTETVYGLGAIWNNPDAVSKIFKIKGRPQDNPLIVHVDSIEEMKKYFSFWDDVADALVKSFTPGPFTLIMEKNKEVVSLVTAGLNTIGIRIPANKIAQEIIKQLGTGVAAPSANISGRPSPTNAIDAYDDLNGKVEYIIDGGDSMVGLESTIVSWDQNELKLLRPGAITAEDIERVLKENSIDLELIILSNETLEGEVKPLAPGMKYRHYAPKAKVHIIRGESIEKKLKFLETVSNKGDKDAYFISEELYSKLQETNNINPSDEFIIFSNENLVEDASHYLFSAFRDFDRKGATDIWAEELEDSELGRAYMNRLTKAADN